MIAWIKLPDVNQVDLDATKEVPVLVQSRVDVAVEDVAHNILTNASVVGVDAACRRLQRNRLRCFISFCIECSLTSTVGEFKGNANASNPAHLGWSLVAGKKETQKLIFVLSCFYKQAMFMQL